MAHLGQLREKLVSGESGLDGWSALSASLVSPDLASATLNLFRAGAYKDQPEELLKTLAYFSDNVEDDGDDVSARGDFLNELLDLDPEIQRRLVNEFEGGSQDETVATIVTSKGFIWRLGRQRADSRMGSSKRSSTREDRTTPGDYSGLEHPF